MNNIEYSFKRNKKNKILLYTISISCIFIGMLLGVYYVKNMGQAERTGLYEYLYEFAENISSSNIDSKTIFLKAMKNTLPLVIIMWIFGITELGFIVAVIVDIIKGFTLGFSIGSFINSLGAKGIWISVVGLIPQNIIYIPCIVFMSAVAMNFSSLAVKNRLNRQWNTNVMDKVMSYSILTLFTLLFCFIGFFIEGYFAPNAIKFII